MMPPFNKHGYFLPFHPALEDDLQKLDLSKEPCKECGIVSIEYSEKAARLLKCMMRMFFNGELPQVSKRFSELEKSRNENAI